MNQRDTNKMGGSEVMMVFAFLLLLELGSWSSGCEGCLEHERSALIQLHKQLLVPHPHSLNTTIDSDPDCCRWESVSCSNATGRVIELDLSDFLSSPDVSPSFLLNASLLTPFEQLESLDLSWNGISGCVGNGGLEMLSKLRNLKFLDLNSNNLNNSIVSSLAALPTLRHLSLAFNKLNGTIDLEDLDSLINLELLDMSENEIDNLAVPGDYRGLKKLNTLDLSGVGIKDGSKLLQLMASFPSLKELYLDYNNFSVMTTNQAFHNLTNLEELILDRSHLHLRFLESVAALTSLKRLSMNDCFFSGKLQGLCELVHLEELYIVQNNLSGFLPECLGNLTSLRVLDVSSNQLTGNISSSPLIHITSLEEITISDNHFQLPISFGPFFNHSKLKSFRSGGNELFTETLSQSLIPKFQLQYVTLSGYVKDGGHGTFPKFLYHQHDLVDVDISHSNLFGEFPHWLLENNKNLVGLILTNNSLSGSFRMPVHLHGLVVLDVSDNSFQGHIPKEIGKYLPNLSRLNLSRNAFNGTIPASFGNMNNLGFLDLSYNQLVGEIPENMTVGCSSLLVLALSNNSLEGEIFSNKFELTDLVILQLDGNAFSGEIPESLSICFALERLYLSDNHLTGKIPRWLGTFRHLEEILMSNNYIEGSIPTEFCQLLSLKVLDLSKNRITGSLPTCTSPLTYIEQVHLSGNEIEGQLRKDAFFCSPSLVTLDLSSNDLLGSFPKWIDILSHLRYLLLANNHLEGIMPVQLCRLQKLQLIDLSHNNISGRILSCLDNTSLSKSYYDATLPTFGPLYLTPSIGGKSVNLSSGSFAEKEETVQFTTKNMPYYYQGRILTSMFGVDLSCNNFVGEIPTQIGHLIRIRGLNLSHNNLTGVIPETFSNLEQIESMDLSYNMLNGKIPSQLVQINTLAVFRVAYNNLSGKVPDRVAQFSTFDEDSYVGNPSLCGLPLPTSCNVDGSQPADDEKDDNNFIDMHSFYITFAPSYILVILGFVGVLWVNPYWRRKWFYLVHSWIISCYYFVLDYLIPNRFLPACYHM